MMPAAAIVTSFVDFAITLVLLAILMAWYGVTPEPTLAALPLFALLAGVLALGIGVFLAALNVKYRDFRYVVPFIVQVGLFVSPIAFVTADVPERWRPVYALNPMVGIIDGFRWSILGGRMPLDLVPVASSVIVAGTLLVAGVWYFRRTERGFADVI
jgi:lipopolysaccharide transport system permease protein